MERSGTGVEPPTPHPSTEGSPEAPRRRMAVRAVRAGAGGGLVVVGVVLLFLPGPGWLTIAAGLVLLSEDVPVARRLEHRVRARLPTDEQERVRLWVPVLSISLAVVATAASLWWTFLR